MSPRPVSLRPPHPGPGRQAGPRFGTLLALFYVFLWASAFVPSSVAVHAFPPFWFLAVRFTTAGMLLAGLTMTLRRPWPRSPREWLGAAAVGLLANAGYLGFTYAALRRGLSAGMGAIVASTNPLVLALLAPALLGEVLTGPKLAGSLLGFGGVVAVVVGRAGAPSARPADVALAFAGVLASVGSTLLFKRRLGGKTPGELLGVTAVQLFAAGLALVPVAGWMDGAPPRTLALSPALVGAFAYLVLVLSVGASLLWFWLLTHGEASRVSAFYYLTPVFGLGLGALLLGEHVGVGDLPGLLAIAAGIALVQRG